MSQKESQKKVEPLIEEEKDFYLSYLNKKLRNTRKKLDQINELSKKDLNTLKPEQLEKVNSKAEVTENIKHYEELKEMYYAAYKESRQTQKESSIEKGSQNQAVSGSKKETGFDEESRKAYKEEVVKDTIKKVLDFISISQILGNSSKKEEFSRLYEAETKDLSQLNGIQELHQQIFDFVESSESTKMEERVNQSMDKLARYINADDQVAVSDKTYKAIQENVESIANFAFFKNLAFATQAQEEVQTNNTAVNNVQEESSIHVSTAAAILKPDIDDFVHSPEKGRYLPKEPKVVRFVDEIERDMQSSQTKQRAQDTSSHSSGEGVQVAKESREPLAPTEAEELNQEPQEQKSFRRNRGNNGSGYKKPRNNDYNNSNNNSQPNRGYSNQRKYGNDGARGYGKNQYREYVQKRPSGDQ